MNQTTSPLHRPGLWALSEPLGLHPGRWLFDGAPAMARNRMIKPEFWTSEQVVECSHSARLLFIGIWNFSDDAGNHPNSIKRLRMQIFPADTFSDSSIEGWLSELVEAGLLSRYSSGGKDFLHVTGWHHQRIEKPTYKYPPHDGDTNSTTTRRPLDEPSEPNEKKRNETKRNEEKRKETKRKEEDVRTIVRTYVLGDLDKIDWTAVYTRCEVLAEEIHETWDIPATFYPDDTPRDAAQQWVMPPDFAEKLKQASAIVDVEAEILPWEWLRDAVCMMLEGKKKTRPAAWIGTVLAATAKEKYGVDFDSFKRAVTIPEGE